MLPAWAVGTVVTRWNFGHNKARYATGNPGFPNGNLYGEHKNENITTQHG